MGRLTRLAWLAAAAPALALGAARASAQAPCPASRLPLSRPASKAFVTDVPTDAVAQPATGTGNAAAWYLQAVNSYQRRRRTKGSLAAGYEGLNLPPLNAAEMGDLTIGSRQSQADFYVERNGAPALGVLVEPGCEPHPMALTVNTMEIAAHAEPLQAFAMATVREAERRLRAGRRDKALAVCARLVRMGSHMRQRPGALTDVDGGIRIEQLALAQMARCRTPNDVARAVAAQSYARSLERLQARVRGIYTALGDVAACRKALAPGTERLWRVLAASAITQAARLRTTPPEVREGIVATLRVVTEDPDSHVSRAAVFQLTRLRRATQRPTGPGRAVRG
jgi:hypothetical protein